MIVLRVCDCTGEMQLGWDGVGGGQWLSERFRMEQESTGGKSVEALASILVLD